MERALPPGLDEYRTISDGAWEIEKVGRRQWRLNNGVEIERFTLSSDAWNKGSYIHQVGEIRHANGTTRILVEETYKYHERVSLRAGDADSIIEQAVGPWLRSINPEHLKDLERIHFSNVAGVGWNGRHHAVGDDFGWIELSNWAGRIEHGNLRGISGTLKHELGHHVWDYQLDDADRIAYARAAGLDISDPEALDFKRDNVEKLRRVFDIGIEDSHSLTGDYSGYNDTNVFEDFAEFYNGFNPLSHNVEVDRHRETYLDQDIVFGRFQEEPFSIRLEALDLSKLLLGD